MGSFQFAFEAIGTRWVIDCDESNAPKDKIESQVKERIESFDKTYSRFRKDSLVWQISKKAGEYTFPDDAKPLFDLYEKLHLITNGAFTLLIGNLLSEAGYDADYSLTPGKINKLPEPSEIFSYYHPKISMKKPFILDFGGLGKGYLIDIVSNLLTEQGIGNFCIDAGGDIYYKNVDDKKLSVGLEHPANFEQVIGIAKIHNQSICASSGNRRAWDKFHHIINPKTSSSPTTTLATWVIASNAITADGLATCLFFTSTEKLKKYFDFEYLILYPDYSFEKSESFPGELFIQRKNLVK